MKNDIADALPSREATDTLAAIDAACIAGQSRDQRHYLGVSQVGHPCDRYVWLTHRGADAGMHIDDARLLRIFGRGHLEESRVIEMLGAAGLDVAAPQVEVSDFGGHVMGHLDGIVSGVPEAPKTAHVLEIKSANDRRWKAMKKNGLREAEPVYFAQVQYYMHLCKLTRALFVAINKNDESLYCERVRLDTDYVDALRARIQRIIGLDVAAPQIDRAAPDHWQCKSCKFRTVCFSGDLDIACGLRAVDCRTCCHVTPLFSGQWKCERHDTYHADAKQLTPCKHHIIHPDLLPGHVPTGQKIIDGVTCIEYCSRSGDTWANGSPDGWDDIPGLYSSHTLTTTPNIFVGIPADDNQ